MSILGTLGKSLFGVVGTLAGSALAGPLGAVAGTAIGNAIGGMGDDIAADEANSEALQRQKEFAKYQSDLSQEVWQKRFDMQNEYNDPSQMRSRLQNAGLNENLVYGQLSGNMAANPSSEIPNGQLSKYTNAMELALAAKDTRLREKQVANETIVAETQADKNQAEAQRARAQARREGSSAEHQDIVNEMMREARRVIGYNPYIQEERNNDYNRMLNTARYNLDKMLGERAADLALDQFSHQQFVDLTYINIAQAKLQIEGQVAASQVQSNMAAAFMMSANGMLAKANENGVWLDNGMKVVDLNYKQFNTYLDVLGKIAKNELTFAQAKETVAKTLNIHADTADKLIKRGQSIVRQTLTGGLWY